MLEFNRVTTKIVNSIKHDMSKSYYCDCLICASFNDEQSFSHHSFEYCVNESYFTLSTLFRVQYKYLTEIDHFMYCFDSFIEFRDYLILYICVNHEDLAKQIFHSFDENVVYNYAD